MSDVELDMAEVFELARLLDLKDVEIAKRAAVAVKDAATTTKVMAAQMAPVDTGALRESLRMTGSRLTRRVVARVPYSAYVEFGTAHRAPTPFLFPASDRGETQLLKDLAKIASDPL